MLHSRSLLPIGRVSATSDGSRAFYEDKGSKKAGHTSIDDVDASSIRARAARASQLHWYDVAKDGNPTLEIRLTQSYSAAFTYAEILQYSCIFFTLRTLTFPVDTSAPWGHERDSSPIERDSRHSTITLLQLYCNLIIFVLATATLGARQKAEHHGLRWQSFNLCLALFFLTCFIQMI